ncbi:DUF222 domain-containing protein [Nocardia otitidiscaviarum]|nr:DUF222 domain-containing protein [Nocardia otitidiscaviarum]
MDHHRIGGVVPVPGGNPAAGQGRRRRAGEGCRAAEHRAVTEEHLADAARAGTPEIVGKVGDRILGYLDPDGTLTTDKDRARVRAAAFGEQRLDGMSPFQGCFDPELRAMVDTVFAKWARPGMCMPDDPDSPQLGVHDPDGFDPVRLATAVGRDVRSAAPRRVESVPVGQWPGQAGWASWVAGVDRVDDVGHRSARGCGGGAGGVEDDGAGAGGVADGAGLDPAVAALRRNPRQAVVFGRGCADRVAMAAVGGHRPRSRLYPPGLLRARDHVRHASPDSVAAADGPTDIDNLTLVCDAHHAQIAADPNHPSGVGHPPRPGGEFGCGADGVLSTGLGGSAAAAAGESVPSPRAGPRRQCETPPRPAARPPRSGVDFVFRSRRTNGNRWQPARKIVCRAGEFAASVDG